MAYNKLSRLLGTLTQSEIRFFRQYAQRHITTGKAIYLKLFDLLLDADHLPESEIRKKLSNKMSQRDYNSCKNYLYDLLLKTLVIQREETSLYARMLKELSAVEVLNDRELMDDAKMKLRKIRAATQSNDLYCLALTASWFEELMMRSTGYTLSSSSEVEERQQNLKELAAQIKAQFDLGALFASYANLNRSGLLKSEEEQHLRNLFSDPLLSNEGDYTLPSNNRLFWVMKMVEARYFGDKELSYDYIRRIFEITAKFPPNFFYHEANWIFSHYLMILHQMEKKDFQGALDTLGKLRSIQPQSKQNRYLQFRLTFQIQLMMLAFQRKHKECLEAISNYESQAKELRGNAFNINEYRIYQSIIGYLMGAGLYKESLGFINTILNDRHSRKRGTPYQLYARVMNLIVHYELGNLDTLESSIRSFEYLIQSDKIQLQYLSHVLAFFNAIRRNHNSIDCELAALGKALEPLIDIPSERAHLFDVIDCGWWKQKGLNLSVTGHRSLLM